MMATHLVGALTAVALVQSPPADQLPPDRVPLFDNLGSLHMTITTDVPKAQRYFDQGLRLIYGFNHAEAIRSFEEAARLDPTCAMCAWGAALAWGPNINLPLDSASGVAAYKAVQRAVAAASHTSPREQAFIRALANRYAPTPSADRAVLDSAYAHAMGEVARQYPGDPDAQVLYADALMNLSPWNYWTADKTPRPGTPTILARLEAVVERHPDHPGACHFYIHAVEAAYPERAVECAERLPALMPGAGHLVHMPAHVYIRVGRYADAIARNEHAVHADTTYISEYAPESGIYTGVYYPHNYHFLAFAATMAGQSHTAIHAARKVQETLPKEIALVVPFAEAIPAYTHLVLVTFGRWDEVLREPLPAPELLTASAMAHYARGVAFAAKGRGREARAALDSLVRIAHRRKALNADPSVLDLLAVSRAALEGEIALRQGRSGVAVDRFREAVRIEDQLPYDEPPRFYYPPRQSLGRALLEAGRAADAEAVYRADLERFPENGWSLFGLAKALRAQGRNAEAAQVESRFRKAWRTADVTLTASRF